MSAEWPQEHELRAMPLLERLEHARRAALVEDKESIDLAIDHIQKLEKMVEALRKSARATATKHGFDEAGMARRLNEGFETGED
jgi:hypothetical protein